MANPVSFGANINIIRRPCSPVCT